MNAPWLRRLRDPADGGSGPPDEPPASSAKGPTDTPEDASTFGVKILLISLSMLFGASLLGYVITRFQVGGAWDGYETEGLRLGLAVSTVVLLACSWFLHRAVEAARAGDTGAIKKRLVITAVLATIFLVNQAHAWWELIELNGGVMRERDMSLFLFYMLTWVHAAHVLFGYPPLAIVLKKAATYGPTNHRGLVNCALYWHFLDVAWILIAIALWIG